MKQPDFTKIFFDYFGYKPKKIRYELRKSPNFLHDLAFLSSLVHDARFLQKDIVLKGQNLTIQIERDCWEIPLTPTKELHIAESKLIFKKVRDIEWVFQDMEKARPDVELWIDGICINETYRSHKNARFDFMLLGHDWKLKFTLENFGFMVKLQDKEIPYLYSKKHAPTSQST